MDKTISPSHVSGEVRPPCSKSYAQRALAAALLSEGETTLSNIELCDDTRYAMDVITHLGAEPSSSRSIPAVRSTGPPCLSSSRPISATGRAGIPPP